MSEIFVAVSEGLGVNGWRESIPCNKTLLPYFLNGPRPSVAHLAVVVDAFHNLVYFQGLGFPFYNCVPGIHLLNAQKLNGLKCQILLEWLLRVFLHSLEQLETMDRKFIIFGKHKTQREFPDLLRQGWPFLIGRINTTFEEKPVESFNQSAGNQLSEGPNKIFICQFPGLMSSYQCDVTGNQCQHDTVSNSEHFSLLLLYHENFCMLLLWGIMWERGGRISLKVPDERNKL